MKLVKRLALGFLALLALLIVIVLVGEAIFHNAGSQKPPDELNSALVVVELHSLLTKGWTEHRTAEDAMAGIPTNRGPAFSQMVWLLQARLETRGVRNTARERLLKPELLARSGGCYPI